MTGHSPTPPVPSAAETLPEELNQQIARARKLAQTRLVSVVVWNGGKCG